MQQKPLKIQRALISVTDKSQLQELAQVLIKFQVEIISSGGTARALRDWGIQVTPVEDVTGNPESFGGRMKTLSFEIGSSLLFRRFHQPDLQDAERLGIKPIDLVVGNLYDFVQAAREQRELGELVEQIDIGGPTLLRAAAKNFEGVAVLSSPQQYQAFQEELLQGEGQVSFQSRQGWALNAFELCSQYDEMICRELALRSQSSDHQLRYGENPHQPAIRLKQQFQKGLADLCLLQGKAMSYNNWLDLDSAWKCVSEIHHHFSERPGVVVVKHLNPCGVALATTSLEALQGAWEGDPVSAFGSIIAFSQACDKDCAQWLEKKFIEIIYAPQFSPEAREILSKKKNLRLLEGNLWQVGPDWLTRSLSGMDVHQQEETALCLEPRSVTEKVFPQQLWPLARLGEICVKYLKSNAIALMLAEGDRWQLVGAGMGQPNRLDSLKRLAIPRAREKGVNLGDCVLVSDAFFPFRDGVDGAHEAGIVYIVQPGGSVRDEEVIAACNENQQAMLFTGMRHFRH